MAWPVLLKSYDFIFQPQGLFLKCSLGIFNTVKDFLSGDQSSCQILLEYDFKTEKSPKKAKKSSKLFKDTFLI